MRCPRVLRLYTLTRINSKNTLNGLFSFLYISPIFSFLFFFLSHTFSRNSHESRTMGRATSALGLFLLALTRKFDFFYSSIACYLTYVILYYTRQFKSSFEPIDGTSRTFQSNNIFHHFFPPLLILILISFATWMNIILKNFDTFCRKIWFNRNCNFARVWSLKFFYNYIQFF